MWVVLKYKSNQIENLKRELKIKFNNVVFYNPAFKVNNYINNKLKIKRKNLLEGYLFCKSDTFSNSKILSMISNLKGLKYFLNGYINSQKEINNFINLCKKHEDDSGFLKQSFFSFGEKTKGYFISGPFTKIFFDIIEESKTKIRIKTKNMNMLVRKNRTDLLYHHI
tara:strand:+ start:158 stop:658 length:501 start_codon:yes stop_codon:yes gene_type:complete